MKEDDAFESEGQGTSALLSAVISSQNIACGICSLVLALSLVTVSISRQGSRPHNPTHESDMVTVLVSLLADHPDYMADLTTRVGGENRMKVATKGGKSRKEWFNRSKSKYALNGMYRNVLLQIPGRPPIAIDPQLKIYADMQVESIPPDMVEAMLERARNAPEMRVVVENRGTEKLDNHEVDRIRITPKSGDDPGSTLDVFVAKDLGNLMIKLESGVIPMIGDRVSFHLSNVSLNVPDELFEIPKGYTKVDSRTLMEAFRKNVTQDSSSDERSTRDLPRGVPVPVTPKRPPE